MTLPHPRQATTVAVDSTHPAVSLSDPADPTDPTDPGWMDRAACRDTLDPEAFFPLRDQRNDRSRGEQERQIILQCCNGCPVRRECLLYALDNNLSYGVWGGTGERARARMARYRRRQARRSGRFYVRRTR